MKDLMLNRRRQKVVQRVYGENEEEGEERVSLA